MSISKAQAEAIAEGLVDRIGSGQDGLVPKSTIGELLLLSGELVEDAQENLSKSKAIASGELSKSIEAEEPVQTGNVVQVDVSMNFYGQFINKGVKGVGGKGQGVYQFRTLSVSKNMLDAIRAWIKRAKLSNQTVKKYKPYGRHETKTRKVSELGSAYAVARSIKMNGIKPRGFMDRAIEATSNKIEDRLGAALKVDVLNSLIDFE